MLKMFMKNGLPKMRGLLVMTMALISPSGREVPRRNRSVGGQKCSCPKFRLETAVFHPESPLLIFSRSKYLKYEKMGTGGGPRWPQPIRASPRGPGAPWWVVPTWLAPSGSFLLQYYLLNTKIISVKFQLHWSCAE